MESLHNDFDATMDKLSGPDSDWQTLGAFYPLEWALIVGPHKVAELLRKGEDSNSAIHLAALFGDIGNIQLLIDAGADVNRVEQWGRGNNVPRHVDNWGGRTPLHYAAGAPSPNAVALLLERGANPNIKDNQGRTPLHYAVATDIPSVSALLIAHHADINSQNTHGITPLQYAVENQLIHSVDILLQHGANKPERSALLKRIKTKHAARNDRNQWLVDALSGHSTAMNQLFLHKQLYEYLRKKPFGQNWANILDYNMSSSEALLGVKNMLEKGVNPNDPPVGANTFSDGNLLHFFLSEVNTPYNAKQEQTFLTDFLAYGGDINATAQYEVRVESSNTRYDEKRPFDLTALEAALHKNNYEMAKLIIKAGAVMPASDSIIYNHDKLERMQQDKALITLMIQHGAAIKLD